MKVSTGLVRKIYALLQYVEQGNSISDTLGFIPALDEAFAKHEGRASKKATEQPADLYAARFEYQRQQLLALEEHLRVAQYGLRMKTAIADDLARKLQTATFKDPTLGYCRAVLDKDGIDKVITDAIKTVPDMITGCEVLQEKAVPATEVSWNAWFQAEAKKRICREMDTEESSQARALTYKPPETPDRLPAQPQPGTTWKNSIGDDLYVVYGLGIASGRHVAGKLKERVFSNGDVFYQRGKEPGGFFELKLGGIDYRDSAHYELAWMPTEKTCVNMMCVMMRNSRTSKQWLVPLTTFLEVFKPV